ncbi:MAG: hypothetical protein N2201_00945 [candidate division WOR-3 bacterium]|nr:hypothetical protein [candidate division WOR-3 bacterium]
MVSLIGMCAVSVFTGIASECSIDIVITLSQPRDKYVLQKFLPATIRKSKKDIYGTIFSALTKKDFS